MKITNDQHVLGVNITVTLCVFVSLLAVNFLCPESRAEALDVNPQAQHIPTKSKDENKNPNKIKDENKSHSENLGVDEGPLSIAAAPAQIATANPNANADVKAMLAYFTQLPNRAEHRVVSGQFVGHAATPGTTFLDEAYTELVGDLETSTGEQIGLVGVDYAQLADKNKSVDLDLTNQPLIEHFADGGMVTVSWHARNPWTGNGARDTTMKGKFVDVVTPGTAAYNAWMAELDAVAAGLADLQNAGISVLFRPLHESNGNAFWWSKASASEFKLLWKNTFRYLTETKKLNNLLWVYSVVPKVSSKDGRRQEDRNYPGSAYVDVTGLDIYAPGLSSFVPSYNRMLKFGKPFGLTEYGPYKGSDAAKDPSLEQPHFSYPILIDEIKQYMPQVTFFQAWNHGHAMAHQLDADLLLKNPWETDAVDWKP